MSGNHALIIGANQGIGLGFVRHLLQRQDYSRVYAAARTIKTPELENLPPEQAAKLTWIPMDITREPQIVVGIEQIRQDIQTLNLVINCVGLLHSETVQPEKSLRQVTMDQLTQYFQVNSVGTVLLAKHLLPLLNHQQRSVFVSISAKVGSIGDNQLGGWYGYRASKAALNMFIRNVAIEYGRKSPKTIVAALHPGTTDTRLSKPFQGSVPPEKLFSVDRTVAQLLDVIDHLKIEQNGGFFSWDGTQLPW
ncbi:MAG: SDR family NAD(P)-dependent oxidoreductase [Oscillatoriales cyanobacterium RM2_1_1]|nr:SDR family NAD(P)-dependent oxidoreductase [Oscillatoriales cyanobacterium SM2_3_0]NJO44771.1 SDR family NAD(P)-dependent oxidoreductase [Oscillatoriales cyanobacterium RM2_1_1]